MKRISATRKKLGMSQWELANLSGISRYNLQLIEYGYKTPSDDQLEKLERALNQPIKEKEKK